MAMNPGIHPAYCPSCNSHYCPHAIERNEYNMRRQDAVLVSDAMWGSVSHAHTATELATHLRPFVATDTARQLEPVPPMEGNDRKKLLLLTRSVR